MKNYVVVFFLSLSLRSCHTPTGSAIQLSISCSSRAVSSILDLYRSNESICRTIQIINLEKAFDSRQGYGRIIELKESRSIRTIITNIKTLTGLEHVRLALANNRTLDSTIKTLAVCAGSGSSVFAHVRNVDLQITGELSHHAVLDAVHRGTSVILCDHTNTERGFLKIVKNDLEKVWNDNQVELVISEHDRDPLEIV